MTDFLHLGDNLPILRQHFADNTVDLCYVDPPFHSRRDYFHPPAPAAGPAEPAVRAFTDRWVWDDPAAAAYADLLAPTASSCQNAASVALLRGLHAMLGGTGLLAYLVSLTLRIAEIRRVLAPHGTFYLHADPAAAHYLKLVCDALFLPGGGGFRNEIIWSYESGGRATRDFAWKHDTILRYAKSNHWTFQPTAVLLPRSTTRRNHLKREVDADGRRFRSIKSSGKIYRYYDDEGVPPSDVWTDLSHLHQRDPERGGYPTQKPEALLERIILASSRPGDLVLDAYCGGGTTLAVARRLNRRWVGIDRSDAAIAATRQRLEAVAKLSAASPPDTPPAVLTATTGPTGG